ncbi:hypothetical protein [Paraburkholderia sp. J63]|uniref:hypothetical protein n=1 Tax=Paraburkholderia sp. J63 TaxID=2805434 RepID=UPI002ABDA943|nr:hypothetical protein [Paraburkholderia sp. J63]
MSARPPGAIALETFRRTHVYVDRHYLSGRNGCRNGIAGTPVASGGISDLAKLGGTVLYTNLSLDDELKLVEALSKARDVANG